MTELELLDRGKARLRYFRHAGHACPTDLDAAWAQSSGIEQRKPERTPLDLLCAVSVAGCAAGCVYVACVMLELTAWPGVVLSFTMSLVRGWRYFRRLPE